MNKRIFFVLLFLPVFMQVQAQEEIVKWTFPNNSLADTVQNSINPLNAGQVIRVEGAGPVSMKNGATDFAIQTINWNDGMNTKNWNINFKTTGYNQVKISSKQRAGGNNGGPKDFKLQYKIENSGSWADLPGGIVTLANNWTTGVINNLNLPAECQNQSSPVYIRWIMASNMDVNGGNVSPGGISKIDDIVVTGMLITGVETQEASLLSSFPNPSSGSFSVSLANKTTSLDIFNNKGQLVYHAIPDSEGISVVQPLPAGIYIIRAVSDKGVQTLKHIAR